MSTLQLDALSCYTRTKANNYSFSMLISTLMVHCSLVPLVPSS